MTTERGEDAMGGPMYWHPVEQVLTAKRLFAFTRMESLDFMRALPDKSVDLVFGSPPYEDSRRYGGVQFRLKGQAWVDWMLPFFAEGVRICKGLMALVVGHGKTDDWRWSGAPALLTADLIRAGYRLRNPPIYGRSGVAGSGQADWLRASYEWTVCVMCNDQGPLPWSNNVAHGHPPKWAPGGEFSNYLKNGHRRNQWGGSEAGIGTRRPNGKIQTKGRPSHKKLTAMEPNGVRREKHYHPPVLANPGNIIYGKVGGGHMGHAAASKSEAAMPLWLAEFFVLSFCPPGGVVYDPFSGSGTTVHAAVENARRGLGSEVRDDQIDLSRRRLEGVSPKLFVESDARKAEAEAQRAAGHDPDAPGEADSGPAGEAGPPLLP